MRTEAAVEGTETEEVLAGTGLLSAGRGNFIFPPLFNGLHGC